MFQKHSTVLGMALGLIAISAHPLRANILTTATATANCQDYSLTVNAIDLTPGSTYTINCNFTLTCGGSSRVVPGSITFTATASTATAGTIPVTLR